MKRKTALELRLGCLPVPNPQGGCQKITSAPLMELCDRALTWPEKNPAVSSQKFRVI